MSLWSHRLQPSLVVLLGGEPALNPDLTKIVLLARKHFPWSPLKITTNGFFLHRHPNLPDAIVRTNSEIKISKHGDDDDYNARFAPVKELIREWTKKRTRIKVDRSSPSWTRRYFGFGESMLPFHDEDPRTSWQNCTSWKCPQLRDGLLWKCPILAYLPMQKAKFPKLSSEWTLGLDYKPLSPDASDDEVKKWFLQEDEPQCSLCPAHPPPFARRSVLIPR